MLTPTITYVDSTGPVIRIGFNLATSGTYTNKANGGDKFNLATAAQDPLYQGMIAYVAALLGTPLDVDVWDAGGDVTTIVAAVLGTNLTNCYVMLASALGTELGNGAGYPGSVTKLIGEAVFNKL